MKQGARHRGEDARDGQGIRVVSSAGSPRHRARAQLQPRHLIPNTSSAAGVHRRVGRSGRRDGRASGFERAMDTSLQFLQSRFL